MAKRSQMSEKQKSIDLHRRIKNLKIQFNEMMKSSNFSLKERHESWKDLIIDEKKGYVAIRCQARKDGKEQCKNKAMKGLLICKNHGGSSIVKLKENRMIRKKEAQKMGLYDIGDKRKIMQEMELIKDVDDRQLTDARDELLLAVSTLRGFLKVTPDDRIMKNPGKLMWLLDSIVRFKKVHWDMKYSPEVVFSRDQVEFLITNIRTIIIKVVKDEETLTQISTEIQKLGIEIQQEGMKK